ncbi:hypothetical protein VW29_04510 [Devosia limi DSM 17137]|uniref:Uncharacterized protein n=1 Tax=Devosia limi DSM 17137 TaxID=1121477 RepID=A0A0F5LUI1_9HYPH|nr:hypothetical protein [Devosia limi]KKB86003.1 hypothetical protein VW29_04510 [Devosia limi DSM 17137]SHF37558.1 hypothetical protein SAMN02745223_02427 [Devosia limi DSM 17137]
MLRHTVPVLVLLAASSVPALAAPFCVDNRTSVSITMGFGDDKFDRNADERALNEADLRTLQRMGVDATSVERWNGCIRAFVRNGDGSQSMAYFDPNTMRQVW